MTPGHFYSTPQLHWALHDCRQHTGTEAQLPSGPSVPFTPVTKVLAGSVACVLPSPSVSYSSLGSVLIRDLTMQVLRAWGILEEHCHMVAATLLAPTWPEPLKGC